MLRAMSVFTSEVLAMTKVAVIDYGVGNLLSVSRALTHCGAQVDVTSDPTVILAADRVILPGVGAFAIGMQALVVRGLDVVVRQVAAGGQPLMGICLGMQLLMEASEEFGETHGLGLVPGRVVPIPSVSTSGQPQKVPHIGWNELVLPESRDSWAGSVLSEIRSGDAAYFVHSFMALPTNPNHRLADCLYGGTRITAAVQCGQVCGFQFHPEKSGLVGLKIVKAFLEAS